MRPAPLLLEQVQVWGRERRLCICEFAKLAVGDDLRWRQRLADARKVALSDFHLATRVTEAVKRRRKQLRR
jgi:hypothetical protein